MIGVGLDARLGLPFDELRAAAREAERLGFESLWTPAGGVPDSFHVCAAWSQDTSLRTGISVVPAARMWTPLSLAAQAATLAQLSSGRFVLGLGTGGYGPGFWESVGLPDRPIAVMREYVTEVRGLLAGEQVTAGRIGHGEGVSLAAPGWPRTASLGVADLPPAPVYLAALGPQMLRLAGEAADGALLNWATPERIAVSRVWIDEGAARGGPRPGVRADDHVHPGLCRRRRSGGAAGVRHAGARLCPGPPRRPGKRRLPGPVRPDGVRRGTDRARAAAGPGRGHAGAGGRGPDEMLHAVGYYGPASAAPAAFARLSAGLDEAMVRIITARPGLQPVVETMEALTPTLIRSWL